MDTWYSLNLGDEPEAYNILGKIKDLFTPIFYASASLRKYEVATFYEDHPETHMLIVYFPPATRDFAVSMGATPCKKPSRTNLVPLIIDQRAWDILFPDDRS